MTVVEQPGPLGERVRLKLLRVAPLRLYTGAVRLMCRVPLPGPLRAPILGALARAFGMDVSEAEQDLCNYRSFHEFFVRRLTAGCRPVSEDEDVVVCPVDGSVSVTGVAERGELIQAKGIAYSLEALLRDRELAERQRGGAYATLYLRPRDYHRIHSPVSGEVVAVRHVPGTLFPVQPYVVRGFPGLFASNERVVLEIRTAGGTVAMVCVAATGVGNVSLAFGSGRPQDPGEVLPLPLERGQEAAAFNLGSTVILVFSPGMVVLEPLVPGQEVRMGQPLGRRLAPSVDRT